MRRIASFLDDTPPEVIEVQAIGQSEESLGLLQHRHIAASHLVLSQPVRYHVLDRWQDQRRAVPDGQFQTPRPVCAPIEIAAGHLLHRKLRVVGVIPATTMNGLRVVYKARCIHGTFKCSIVASDNIEVSRHEGTVSMDGSSSPAHKNSRIACC